MQHNNHHKHYSTSLHKHYSTSLYWQLSRYRLQQVYRDLLKSIMTELPSLRGDLEVRSLCDFSAQMSKE